jgi:tripartite tricarboxylate transporter TctB family protein
MTAMSEGRRRWDAVFALILVAGFAYWALTALSYPADARLLPIAVALPALALAVIQLALSLRRSKEVVAEHAAEPDALTPAERTRRTLEIAGWIIGIFVAVYLLGFPLAVPLAAVAYLRVVARESWVLTTVVAALCWGVVFGIFDRVLHVPLPVGQLLRLFGMS